MSLSSPAFERQLRPVYDALDTGSNKSALLSCNKLLKKYPKNDLLKALKALALLRSQKIEETLALCDEILASKPTDDGTLSAMMHVLRGLGRHSDMVSMFDEAFKQNPGNEELGIQSFFANLRTSNWKAGQQLATKMHKTFRDDRYVYWGIMCAVLQAKDHTTPSNVSGILYKLAHRLMLSVWTPMEGNPDRLYLHVSILRQLELYEDARTLLESEQGKVLCSRSLACDELRRDIYKTTGWMKEEGVKAKERIENGDRNWLEFLSVLDATFPSLASPDATSSSDDDDSSSRIQEVRELLDGIAAKDGLNDRSASLALLELEKRARTHGLATDPSRMLDLLKDYLSRFGDKSVCYEDLRPYTSLEGEEAEQWSSHLDGLSYSSSTLAELQRQINVYKLRRYSLQESQLTVELEVARADELVHEYIEALALGKGLPKTELQPADDLAVLAGHVYVSLYQLTKDESYLHHAVVVLEFASKKSPQSYQIHLSLVQIYRLLGAPQPALEHYRLLNVKQIQTDTLSHYLLSRSSTFSMAPTGDITYIAESFEQNQIYLTNTQETAEYVVKAFGGEKYSQIPDFVLFEDWLDNSLQRNLARTELLRMRITHEPISQDLFDVELIELKFNFDRRHHDNRDFDVMPNYQPRCQPSFQEQTRLFGRDAGHGWLWNFLRIYIRAFQHASDLSEAVEEKLLIGDRPKQPADLECRLPLDERLDQREPEELAELTPDEHALLDYGKALGDWLEPYHNHTRPPPAQVLAEAVRMTELKTGHTLKNIELSPENGNANGHAKKAEDAPQVQEPPPSLVEFFDNMLSRFKEVSEAKGSVQDLLHVAVLTQEAFILFAIETFRFKNASTVKVNKLGALVQSFKPVRAKAVEVLKEISSSLTKLGEGEGTAEKRKAFVEGCKSLQAVPELNHDYVLDIAKKVTDARKKVLEGVGKGMTRVATNYAS